MNYSLYKTDIEKEKEKKVLVTAWRRLVPLLAKEGSSMTIALIAIVFNSVTILVSPFIIGRIVDLFIVNKDFHGVLIYSGVLAVIYIVGLFTSYIQIMKMGGIGRRVLFDLRNTIFKKIQDLPVAFFNQNKAGDLISRINNDTDKLNQFFSQALVQFIGNAILIIGAGVFIVVINPFLGIAAIMPAVFVLIVTKFISAWVKRTNLKSLRTLGGLSGEISESISNFKVVVAFNRVDYFQNKFKEANDLNYNASVSANIASSIFSPLYIFASTLAQVVVLIYGIYLISLGQFTVGLLIGFLLYVNSFYTPLRQLASVWSSLQLALAGLDRISEVLMLESNLKILESDLSIVPNSPVIEFKNVSFKYSENKEVLKNLNFSLKPGKTYALVGPTGGGKTTTALLMARLYDPTEGEVLLFGKDIKTFANSERTKSIGFILQEPFLLVGTVRENLLYGNDIYKKYSNEDFDSALEKIGFDELLKRFPGGLDTNVTGGGDSISLGQKQLIAFIRAVLREPDILILDEATANIDTVTEQLLEEVLKKLPEKTTRVIIAHRLNTIENADEIFFVNNKEIILAGSKDEAVNMLLHKTRTS
jgi:ATP-binding cassette subfamily B protein